MKKKYTAFDWFVSAFLFGVPVVVSTMIALLVPSDILRHEWARYWVEFVLQVFPKLLDVPNESLDPDVVKFYHAAMLSFVFFWVLPSVYVLIISLRKAQCGSEKQSRTKKEMAKIWMSSLVFAAVSWSVLSFEYGGGKGAALWYSRFSLIFGGFIFHLGLLMGASAFIAQTIEIFIRFRDFVLRSIVKKSG